MRVGVLRIIAAQFTFCNHPQNNFDISSELKVPFPISFQLSLLLHTLNNGH